MMKFDAAFLFYKKGSGKEDASPPAQHDGYVRLIKWHVNLSEGKK